MTTEPVLFAEVSQAIQRLWRALERFDYEAVIALLAPDVRWDRAGRWREGHEEVRAVLNERPQDLIVRHALISLEVDKDGEDVVARYTLASYNSGGSPEEKPPFSKAHTRLIADASDRLTRIDGQLRFRELTAQLVFLSQSR